MLLLGVSALLLVQSVSTVPLEQDIGSDDGLEYSPNVLDLDSDAYDYRYKRQDTWPSEKLKDLPKQPKCSEGYYEECLPCPIGYFKPRPARKRCAKCGSNRGTPSVGATWCTKLCNAGEKLLTDAPGKNRICAKCEKGTYQPSRNVNFTCNPCPDNWVTTTEGSIHFSDCFLNCSAGHQPTTDKSDCEPCPVGTFKSIPGSGTCQNCTSDKTTLEDGAFYEGQCVVLCEPGTQFTTTSGGCNRCEPGTFKDSYSSRDSCISCPENSVPNMDEGATECIPTSSEEDIPACAVSASCPKTTCPLCTDCTTVASPEPPQHQDTTVRTEMTEPKCPEVTCPPTTAFPEVTCPACPTPTACPEVTCPICPTAMACPELTCPTAQTKTACPEVTFPSTTKCPELTCPDCPTTAACPEITYPTTTHCPEVTLPTTTACPEVKCPTSTACPVVTCPLCPTTTERPPCPCPDNWRQFGDSCYIYVSTILNGYEAEENCRKIGGHLAEVATSEQNGFLFNLLSGAGTGYGPWLGGVLKDGIWTWRNSGTPIAYVTWNAGEPNGGEIGENCLHYYKHEGIGWNDATCAGHVFPSLCEREVQ